MNHLKISTRLLILIGLMSALLIAIGAIGLFGMSTTNAAFNSVYMDRMVPVGQLADAQRDVAEKLPRKRGEVGTLTADEHVQCGQRHMGLAPSARQRNEADAAGEVADGLLRRKHLDVDQRLQHDRPGQAHRFDGGLAPGGDEGNVLAVHRVRLAVIDRDADVVHREARHHAFGQRFALAAIAVATRLAGFTRFALAAVTATA